MRAVLKSPVEDCRLERVYRWPHIFEALAPGKKRYFQAFVGHEFLQVL